MCDVRTCGTIHLHWSLYSKFTN